MKIAYVGNFSQAHCTEVHLAATLVYLGHEVVLLQENDQHPATLSNNVKGIGHVDLFLWTRTWTGHVSLEDLKAIHDYGIPTVSYHLDLYVGLQREDGLDNDPFWRTDYVFTPDGDPRSAEVFKRKGINHHYMKPAVYKPECYYGDYKPELAHDVVFVGGGIEYMHPEWPYRRQLVQWLIDNYQGATTRWNKSNLPVSRFGKYGHPQQVMRNKDLNDLYASAKIAVGDSICIPDFKHENYWSDRVYETMGRGGFLIHPYIKGMEEEFTDKETIVFYEYGNLDQLKSLIDYYLEHDEERERIRKAGHEYVKLHCTYHNRLAQTLKIVFPSLGGHLSSIDSMPLHPLKTNGGDPLKINLGAGADPTEGYVNVDMVDLPGIDVVHNLMSFPYCFEDESATHIRAVDVLEHLDHYTDDKRPSVIAFIEECWRILKPGGELFIQTPRYDAAFLWIDPTHVRGFHEESLDFFDPDKHFGQTTGFYSKAKFSVSVETLENKNLRFTLVKR